MMMIRCGWPVNFTPKWTAVFPDGFCHSAVPGPGVAHRSLFSLCCLSLRYSLTEEGLSLAERLESAEHGTTDGPEGGRVEVRSEGEEAGEEGEEEGGPGVVDLTGSDEDEEEKEEDRMQ